MDFSNGRLSAVVRAASRALSVAWLVALIAAASTSRAQTRDVAFDFVEPINIGGSLGRYQADWNYFLGAEFGTSLNIGGMVGDRDVVVIPEVKLGEAIIVPEIRGDTRTGLRVGADVTGRAGIDLNASFNSGGVSTAANFNFGPTLSLPSVVSSGDFFRLDGSVGLDAALDFDVDLPSVSMGSDLVFELDVDGDMEAALFPFVPYRRGPWGIDLDFNFSLFDLDFDLNLPQFPDFQFLGLDFPELPGAEGDVFRKQLSVEPKPNEGMPGETPTKPRVDVGEVQLVRPVGANIDVRRKVDADGFQYTVDADLLRLGIDIDGLASAAVAGTSFTRQEWEVGDFGKLVAELVDVKYGPELGIEVTSSVSPYLKADLTFDQDVLLKEDGLLRTVQGGEIVSVRWDQVPEIALLGEEDVQVDVEFTEMEAAMSQSGQLTLSDYMELRVLALEAKAKVGKLNVSLAKFGPLIHQRFSILGELLGEAKIPIWETDFDPVSIDLPTSILNTTHDFTIQAIPSQKAYMASDQFGLGNDDFLELSSGVAPMTLIDKTLVVAVGDGTQSSVEQLTPVEAVDDFGAGDMGVNTAIALDIAGLEVPPGSKYTQQGARRFRLRQVTNDGAIENLPSGYVHLQAAGGLLKLQGSGVSRYRGVLEIGADQLINGRGHTLVLEAPPDTGLDVFDGDIDQMVPKFDHALNVTESIDNSGSIVINGFQSITGSDSLVPNLSAGLVNRDTGELIISNRAGLSVITPLIQNEGLIEVTGTGSVFNRDIFYPTISKVKLSDPAGTGRWVASDGGHISFGGLIDSGGGLTEPATSIEDNARFEAVRGGSVSFADDLYVGHANVDLITDETGSIILNGIDFPLVTSADSFEPGVNIVNHGLLLLQSGKNLLYLPGSSDPGGFSFSEIKPINLVNEGTVRIHDGAEFGFQIEIANYAEGGATLAGGAWELLGGDPAGSGYFDNTTARTAVDENQSAILVTEITKISAEDNVLGGALFEEAYDIEAFDTDLTTNAAKVTLSGRALFPFFNTVEQNEGTITLQNRHRFTTAGNLTNRGRIAVETGARLEVAGDLIVDEGEVFVAQGSAVAAQGTIELIGGAVTSEGPLSFNSRWDVREKWIGVDAEGNDLVVPARVESPSTVKELGSQADVTIAGLHAEVQPLDQLSVLFGRLNITEGNHFESDQDFYVQDGGSLIVDAGGSVRLGATVELAGELIVGEQSYLETTSIYNVDGVLSIEGVLKAASLQSESAQAITLAGQLVVEDLFLGGIGPFQVEVGEGRADVDNTVDLGLAGDLQLTLCRELPRPSDSFTILAADELVGEFDNVGDGERLEVEGGVGSFLVDYDGGSISLTDFLATPLGSLSGDFNGDFVVDGLDFLLWQRGQSPRALCEVELSDWEHYFGERLLSSENAAEVPEPSAALLALLASAAAVSRRRGRRGQL